MVRLHKFLLSFTLAFLLLDSTTEACTGRASKQSKGPRQSTPLTLRQRVPNVSENTLGASGPPEGQIHRDNPKFDELLPKNLNKDIVYKDEEMTGADKRMSMRCKDKLNSLAISVMNQWPDVRLRVIEAWDEDGYHEENSLHYEGRAVDITTSDRDRDKYGLLARLAVEAGFDWVSFESKTWVHCSVKSDSSEAAKSGGCFPADSVVSLQNGETRTMTELQIGDKVKVVDKSTGLVTFSDVIMFLDRTPSKDTFYYVIQTDRPGYTATLTPQHVIYVSDTNSTFSESRAVFASDVQTGQYLYTTVHDHDREARLQPARVTDIRTVQKPGAVAPLTYHGTLVVDGVAASNYAILDVDWVSHAAFAPIRWWHSVRQYIAGPAKKQGQPTVDQVHWYPAALYKLSKPIIGSWYHSEAFAV